jgi:hypothetical protein
VEKLEYLTLLIPNPESEHDKLPVSFLSYTSYIIYYHASNKHHDCFCVKNLHVACPIHFLAVLGSHFYNDPITIELFWLSWHSLVEGTDVSKLTVSSFFTGLVIN